MHELFDWIYSIVVALFIAMIIHIFLFDKLHFIISRRHAEMFLEDGRREPSPHVRTL